MSNPAVSVGLRKGKAFIISQLSPGRGTYLDKEPIRQVSADDAAGLGRAILDAFGDFTEISEMPNLLNFRSPVIKAAGVRSYAEYERGLKDCLVVIEDDRLHIMWSGPHTYLPRDVSPEDLGTAVFAALQASPSMRQRRTAKGSGNKKGQNNVSDSSDPF
jgi:hypothetical protein